MLEVSVPIAHELLAQCVRQGQALVQRASLVGDHSDYESWRAARNQWVEPTAQALAHMYGGPSQAGEFAQAVAASGDGQRWQQQYAADLEAVKAAIDLLTVLQGELAFVKDEGQLLPNGSGAPELTAPHALTAPDQPAPSPAPPFPEPQAEHPAPRQHVPEDRAEPAPERQRDERVDGRALAEKTVAEELLDERPSVGAELAPAPPVGAELAQHANGSVSAQRTDAPEGVPAPARQVLLAHGRNERWMKAVAHLLAQAGTHEVTILNERASARTLAEQFSKHVPGSRYAVVLLTADDIAAPRVESEEEPYFSPRAHQAVVFEMGFLVAALAPGQVCVLYEEGVQLPCDLEGIAYVRLDLAGTWQPKLLLQLRKAGFDYDLNKLVAA
jgi:predicted nucleotide-binding protein